MATFLLMHRGMDNGRDQLTERIIGCALEVHRGTGPGLLESIYDVCLAFELRAARLDFERQVALPFRYKAIAVTSAFKLDLVVERRVLVEIKAVEAILPVHKAQVLTYMKLANIHTGLLLNFNVVMLRDGIRRLSWTPELQADTCPDPHSEFPDRLR